MSKGLSIYQQAVLKSLKENGPLNIVEVCNLILRIRAIKKDPSSKPSIWTRIGRLEELDYRGQEMYRMMRSLEKRGLVARLLHRRPAVWYLVSWNDGKPILDPESLESGSLSNYHINYVAYRDGQVSFKTKEITMTIRGIKMTGAQLKRQM